MRRPTEITYKTLAPLIANKSEELYNKAISPIQCRLSFSLLRSAIINLCSSRSTAGHPLRDFDFMVVDTEGSRLPLTD